MNSPLIVTKLYLESSNRGILASNFISRARFPLCFFNIIIFLLVRFEHTHVSYSGLWFLLFGVNPDVARRKQSSGTEPTVSQCVNPDRQLKSAPVKMRDKILTRLNIATLLMYS